MSKTWFITGASRGFGALIADAALGQGDNVVATARNPATVTSVLGQPENLLAASLDVTSEAQAREAADAAMARFGRIDVLVNNAGFGLLGAVEESSAEEVELDASSLLHSRTTIPDYAQTVANTRNFAATTNHSQPGDPAKLARALLELVSTEDPPLRIPFGSDAIRRIEAKSAFVAQELARWRDLSVSTDATVI
jgi:short chain dehydrogenase